MLARYEGNYAAATLIVMGERKGFEWKDVPPNNYIDTLVYDKLKKVKVMPSDLCTDGEFIRRVYLDLVGQPPQPDETRAFLADPRPSREKRDALVDKLIGSPDFIEHWTNKWADLLQVNRKFLAEKGATEFRAWIRKAVADNMAYDKFAYAILTASGSNVTNPPASYYKILRKPDDVMENTTHLFLAIRFNCNKCHDHPFERWTQDQYYDMAAYFARVGRREDPAFKGQKIGGTAVEGALPAVEIISDVPSGDVKHERTGVVTPPKFPFRVEGLDTPPTASRREQMARWITSKDNPYFAKSYVNRLWSYLLGVGIIEPVDDIRAGNPASNPQLLDRLTNEFIASGFKGRQLLATICKSRTYQHSFVPNALNQDDDINYSHWLPDKKRLPAEVLFDAVHLALGAQSRVPGLPPGTRAAQMLDSNVAVPGAFLALLGKPVRESACECERSNSMMLGSVLNLVNGPVVNDAVRDPTNRLAKLVAAQKDDAKLIEELFLSILCRKPTKREIDAGIQAIKESEDDHGRLLAEHKTYADAVAAYEKLLPAKQAEWEKNVKRGTAWTFLDIKEAKSRRGMRGATLTKEADESIFATGNNEGPEIYQITATTKLAGITAFRLEVLSDPRLPGKGPGRSPNGNFVLNELRITVGLPGKPGEGKLVTLHRAAADFSQQGFDIAGAIDGNTATGWAVSPQVGKSHVAVFETKEPLTLEEGKVLNITLDQQYVDKLHNIGKFRLSATTAKPPVSFAGPPEAVAQVLAIEPEKRTDAQKAEVARFYRTLDPELARLNRELAEHPLPPDKRLLGVQDYAWALINSPAFLFNH
jgi:hypothetical protein